MSTLNVEFLKQENSSSNNVTLDSDGSVAINRHTSDGTIIDLQKDGTSVGTIGSYSGVTSYWSRPSVGGIRLGGVEVAPSNTVGGANDASLSLGDGSNRWKDLYLSGGVYLGGTGAANKLDDYEEGSWTPTLGGGSVDPTVGSYDFQVGRYTKIGNLVTLWFICNPVSVSGGSGTAVIKGSPFTPSSNTLYSQHQVLVDQLAADRRQVSIQIEPNDNRLIMIGGGGSTGSHFGIPTTDFGGGETIRATVTFETT